MHDNELRNTLSERFEGYGSQPSDAVWGAIEANLEEEDRKRGFFWWWMGLAATIALFIGVMIATSDRSSADSAISSNTETNEQTEIPATENQNTESTNNSLAEQADASQNPTTNPSEFANQPVDGQPQIGLPAPSVEQHVVPNDIAKNTEGERNELPYNTDAGHEQNTLERPEVTAQLKTAPLSSMNTVMGDDHSFFVSIPPGTYKTPRWELTAEVSTFSRAPEIVTTEKSIVTNNTSDNSSISTESLTEPSSPDAIITSHARYAELQLTIRRKFGQHFQIGTGLSTSYSRNSGGTVSGDYQFKTNIWSVGVPVHLRFSAVNYRRFSLTPYLSLLNEFHFSSYSSEGMPPSTGSSFLADASTSVTSPIRQQAYVFGVQPSLEFSYYATERLSIAASFGYRNYFVRDYLGFNPAVRQPNYFQFAVGTSWILK